MHYIIARGNQPQRCPEVVTRESKLHHAAFTVTATAKKASLIKLQPADFRLLVGVGSHTGILEHTARVQMVLQASRRAL